jgi:MSHA biogenesis protein MshQ
MSVYKAGFILDIPNLRAGTKYENLEITAVQSSSPDSTVCTPLFESGERKIYFWGQYINPDTGKGKAILIDENSIETINKNAAPDYNNIPQNLTFTNGTATLPPVQYNDVGLMQLNARYLGSEEHEDTGMVVFGSDTFVVKPHHFRIENIKCSDGNGNPGAIDYQGNKFCRAGDDFSVEVSARNAERGITENYGREDSPESINIVSELVQPVGGNAPELSVPSVSVLKNCEGLDADATFCVTTSWPEVGIIKLIPGIGDGDYLGAGDVNEDSIEYVGRFYPHHFELTQGNLINRVESGCTDSVFTYLGENLDFSYTLTAKNALDNPTQNYVEPFHKFSGDDGETPFSGEIYSVNAIHDPSNSAYPLSDRVVIDTLTRSSGWENGTARFTARLSVERGDLPDGPFDDVRFGLYVEDGDGVSIAAPDLDTDADGDADSSQVAPHTQLRYGRLQVANSHGSELLALEGIEIFAEYYDETHEIFRLNSSDSCTSYAAEGINWDSAEYFNGLSQNITATGTGDLDNGRNTFSIHNTADTQAGPGSTGYVVYEFPTHSWLQYDWKGEGDENPSARATFGIFKGNERIIYLRETTWR